MCWRPGGCTWTCGPPSSSRRRGGLEPCAAACRRFVVVLPVLRGPRPDRPGPHPGVARPVVDPDYTATVGLDRDQARALVAAADADAGAQALRTAAVVRLLLHNALRVDEACAADIADLGEDSGHRVVRVVRKGARKAKIPLTPATVAALEAYLADRARRARVADWRQLTGPLLATATGGRLRQGHLWELVRRLARTAGGAAGSSSRRTACATRRSPSPWTPRLPARRAGLRRPQRSPHHPPLRPLPRQPGPQRRLHRRRLPSVTVLRTGAAALRGAVEAPGWLTPWFRRTPVACRRRGRSAEFR